MSNLVLLVSDAFENYIGENTLKSTKEKIKLLLDEKLARYCVGLVLLFFTIYVVYFIFFKSNWIFSFCCILFQIVILGTIDLFAKKLRVQNYSRNSKAYHQNLEILKKVLKNEFKLYSENQVRVLISECDKIINNLKVKSPSLLPALRYTYTIAISIMTFILGTLIESISVNWFSLIQLSLVLIVGAFVGGYIFFSIKEVIEDYMNEECKQVIRLKGMLTDIYLIEFANTEVEV